MRLVQGKSALGIWDVTSEVTDARINVGSGDGIEWPVACAGVESVHFQLYWDGRMLWVSPPQHGTLLVDGEPVNDWRQLAGRCRIDFGGAAMLVETSSAAVSSLSETPLVEPLPEGSNVDDFIGEQNEVKTVLFQGSYDFEHGNHQALGETAQMGAAFRADDSDVHTVLVDPATTRQNGPVASPFRGKGSSVERSSLAGTRKLETALGSRFAKPELSGVFPPTRFETLLKFRPTAEQVRIAIAVTLAVFASLVLWQVRAQRAAVTLQQEQLAQVRAQQEQAQAETVGRAVAVRARMADEAAAIQAEQEDFLNRRRIRFAELRAREEAIAEVKRRRPNPQVIPRAMRQERLDLESRGAALVFANDFEGALTVYRQLDAAYGDEPAYRSVIKVLQSKQRCQDGRLPTGEPCR